MTTSDIAGCIGIGGNNIKINGPMTNGIIGRV